MRGLPGRSAFGYTQRQPFFHEGDTLLALGDGQARCRLEAGQPEQALGLSQDTLLGLERGRRPEIVLRAARVLGCLVAARYAGLPAVREYREALLTG